MAKKYKILPIQHLLKNNAIAKAGDVVSAGAFVNLQDSLDRGFCEEVESNEDDNSGDELTETQKTVKHLKTLNKEPLQTWGKENEYIVDEDLNKKKLLASLIEQVEADEEEAE